MIPLEEILNAPLLPTNLPSFEIIKECQKAIDNCSESGSDSESEEEEIEEVFPCECRYYEHSSNFEAQACGASANCINRELFIECNGEECPCQNRCQNQRFQNRQYAQVKVIETPGKGFGLFVCEDLKPGNLIIEYVGEVVDQEQMGRRAEKYAKLGQPHFYFMTLRPNQIIDATCKGNLSRFMNHSCSPNSETQKWIVGGRIKIGLFALKAIKAGSELTFDYKFVRFGNEPQKCLCGEVNCTGFIGVSSQNNNSKSSQNRSGRKRKQVEEVTTEDSDIDELEVFMESDPKFAELPGQVALIVTKLIQTDELEIIKKLLKILESTEKYLCQRKFLNLHGLKLLLTLLTEHVKDSELVFTILKILNGLPLSTRNSIQDAGWFDKLNFITANSYFDQEIRNLSSELYEKWNKLEEILKAPKKSGMKGNSVDTSTLMSVPSEFSSALNRKRQQWTLDSEDRVRDSNHERELKSEDYNSPHKSSEASRSRSPVKKMIPDPMWLSAYAPDGKVYYYHSVTKETTWDVPMIPTPSFSPIQKEETRGQSYYSSRDDKNNSRDSRSERYRDDGNFRHRDSRDRDSRDNRDYRDSRDHRDTRESRDSRDHRDIRESRDYRSSRESVPSKFTSTQSSALLEGIEDSSQLTAVIERAKARRIQHEDECVARVGVEAEEEFITSPISSEGQLHGVDKKYYVKLKEEVSGVVIRFLSHYKNELGGDFKSIARKYTHKIVEKELKDSSITTTSTHSPSGAILNAKKKQKIKYYLGEVLNARGIKSVPDHVKK